MYYQGMKQNGQALGIKRSLHEEAEAKDWRSRESYPFYLHSFKADALFYFNLLQAYSTKHSSKYSYLFTQHTFEHWLCAYRCV